MQYDVWLPGPDRGQDQRAGFLSASAQQSNGVVNIAASAAAIGSVLGLAVGNRVQRDPQHAA
jgi:hypothetical protein